MHRRRAGVPRGVEVLVKKAAVDPAFRALLLQRRAGAAREIGLDLDAAEAAMLAALPREQLENIISRTKVSDAARPAFLGTAAAVMLAALGLASCGCDDGPGSVRGVQPDRPEEEKPGIEKPAEEPKPPPPPPPTRGVQPDRPSGYEPVSKGMRADRPPPPPPADEEDAARG